MLELQGTRTPSLRSETRPTRRSPLGRVPTLVAALAVAALAAGATDAGTLSGRVLFQGEAPPSETVAISQDSGVCGSEATRTPVSISSDGGLRWAVVQLSGGGTPQGSDPTDLVQKGCEFAPHVVVARAGEEIGVLNEDGILHNFHTYSEKNAVVNLAQPGFVKRLPLTFDEPERVRVTCDVHSWMEGWVVVADDAMPAVTDAEGAFAFTDVPAGEHEVRVWHPTLGEQTTKVTVGDGQDATLTIEYGS